MKILILALSFFCLTAFSQETNTSTSSKTTIVAPTKSESSTAPSAEIKTTEAAVTPQEAPAKKPGIFLEASTDARRGGKGAVRAGFYIGSHWLITGKSTMYQDSQKTSGGDLQTWNYVEQTYDAKSSRQLIELTYFLNPISIKKMGPYATLGFGRADDKLSYKYERYKPYNGATCLGAVLFGLKCPTIALEEGDGGEQTYQQNIATLGVGYLLGFEWGATGWGLRLGANYTTRPEQRTEIFGKTRKGAVSSLNIDEFTVEAALSIGIPWWF